MPIETMQEIERLGGAWRALGLLMDEILFSDDPKDLHHWNEMKGKQLDIERKILILTGCHNAAYA